MREGGAGARAAVVVAAGIGALEMGGCCGTLGVGFDDLMS